MGKLVNLKEETLKVMMKHGYCLDDVLGMKVLYGDLFLGDEFEDEEDVCKLIVDDVADFDKLDIDYDNGYGHQYVMGWIVFKDKTWLERVEYDGSEWWAYRKCPM